MNQNAQPQQAEQQQPQGKPKRGIIVFDLDGCLYLTEWRRAVLEEHGVAAYNRMHAQDEVNRFGRRYLEDAVAKGIFVIFITERTVDYVVETSNKIVSDFGIDFGADFSVYMRPLDDSRPAVELKQEILTLVLAMATTNRTKVIGAFDDDPEIVQMYRANGIVSHKLDAFGCSMDDGTPLPLITILDEKTFDRYQNPTASKPVALAEQEPFAEPAEQNLAATPTPSQTLEEMAESVFNNAESLLKAIRLQTKEK